MVTVKSFIRISSRSKKETNIRLRLVDGRRFQLYVKTPLMIDPALWDSKTERLKSRVVIDRNFRRQFDDAVEAYKRALEEVYYEVDGKEVLTEELALSLMEMKLSPARNTTNINKVSRIPSFSKASPFVQEARETETADFYDSIDRFLEEKQYPYSHAKTYITLKNTFKRFELYKQLYSSRFYKISFKVIDEDFLLEFRDFIFNEYRLAGNKRYERIYKEDQKHNYKILVKRGNNTMVRYFKRFRTFWKWAMKKKIARHDPFEDYTIGSTHDGTPYYITIQERDKIYHTDLEAVWNRMSNDERHEAIPCGYSCLTIPRLIRMRDIFIFQCMIGCRVGDLVKFTPHNISNNILTYVPRKTKNNANAFEVTVPLNQTAREIVEKYRCTWAKTGKLFPFQTPQKYNRDLKLVFTLCGITRQVPVLNSITGEYDQRPLNEVASSHMARRTFIGNLYKKVKDPNLIGKLSGHVEGSKAFCRYRNIDMDMKRELVDMLE